MIKVVFLTKHTHHGRTFTPGQITRLDPAWAEYLIGKFICKALEPQNKDLNIIKKGG